MNRLDHIDDVVEAAIAWRQRLDAPDATDAEWEALGAWLEGGADRREAFDAVEMFCAEVDETAPRILHALDLRSAKPTLRRPVRPAARRARRGVWAAAAGFAAAAAAAAVFVAVQPSMSPPAPTEVFQTAKGEDRLVTLADGSRINLNSGSRISVRLERKARRVELVEGEAAFDVTHDPDRPFLIAAGERDIRVVGTQFNVLRHDGRLKVTVRRGVVSVQAPEDGPRVEPVLLRAGYELDHRPGGQVWTVRAVDPQAAFAWIDGNLIYRGQRLDDVASDLNRYFETPVTVVGPARNLAFSGVLRLDDEAAVIRRLEAFLPVEARSAPDGVTLTLRGDAG